METTELHITKRPLAALVACLMAILIGLSLVPGQALAVSKGKASGAGLTAGQVVEVDSQAAAGDVSGITVKGRARSAGIGWKSWVGEGKTIGSSSYQLRRIRLQLDGVPSGLDGGIRYVAYDKLSGWTTRASDGAVAGRTSEPIRMVKIWLSGSIAEHYDVIYRGYVRGRGWQDWVKNKAKAGTLTGGAYLTAIQVKLSPKTEEAAGYAASKVGIRYQARIRSVGWQAWTGDGKRAGKSARNVALDSFAFMLDAGKLSGGVKGAAYVEGQGWEQGWRASGSSVGVLNKRIEALKFKLTGAIAKKYDIYYSTYVAGYGWLDWAKNGQVSGSTGLDLPIAAARIKLVKKGLAVAGAGSKRTVNAARTTLDGIDISSWQSDINIAKVKGDFVIVKATGGVSYTNPFFKLQANATLKSGKLLGLYHFARERTGSGSAVQEADYFVKAVGPYVGRAVLVLDWEADALFLGPTWAKKFLDRVYAKTGVRPLIYMSKNPARSYDWSKVAKRYKLWVAQYANYNATGYQKNPWTDDYGYGAWSRPTLFQYSSNGRLNGYGGALDLNVFYGKRADWKALAAVS